MNNTKKRKEKTFNDKENNDENKQSKNAIIEGKILYQKAICGEQINDALDHFNRAINKSTITQILHLNHIYHYRGLCFFKLKKYQEAQRDFQQAISISDQKSKANFYNSLGKCKSQMSTQSKDTTYLEEAIKCFQKSIQYSGKQDPDAYYQLGTAYRKMKQNSKAIQCFSKSIELKHNNSYLAYIERGLCLRQLKELDKSINDLQHACELKKDMHSAYFHLGINYLLGGKYEDALEKLQRAIEIEGSQPQYHNYKGLALYLERQFEACLSVFNKALKLYEDKDIKNSQVAECYYNKGNALLNLSRSDLSLLTLQQALSQQFMIDKELRIKIYYSQGRAYENTKMYSQGSIKFKQCLRLIDNAKQNDLFESGLYHLGYNQLMSKHYLAAIESFTTILEYDCTVKNVFEMRGKAYLESSKYQLALKDFEALQNFDDKYPQIYYLKGKTKINIGQIDSALDDFFYAVELGSRNNNIYNGISQAYLIIGKFEKALIYSNLSLEKQPQNQIFLIQRSRIFLELGEKAKGIEDLTKALQLNPTNPLIYYRRGLAYFKNKQNQSAILDLIKALENQPSKHIEADIQYHLGVSYARLQQSSNAIIPFTNAINVDAKAKYYHQRSKCYLLADQYLDALNDLNQVILLQPQNAYAYFRRGLAHKGLKMYNDASEDFSKARQIAPDDPSLIINKKQIYYMKYRKLCQAGQQQ